MKLRPKERFVCPKTKGSFEYISLYCYDPPRCEFADGFSSDDEGIYVNCNYQSSTGSTNK